MKPGTILSKAFKGRTTGSNVHGLRTLGEDSNLSAKEVLKASKN